MTQKNDLNFRGRILDETLKPIPDIPEELKQAARDGTLIPFIGAGVSSLVGCPRWREFADDVLKFFIKNGALDYNEFEQLKKLPPRTVLSIAQDLEKSTGHNIPYDLIIEGKKKNHTGENIYHHLSRLSDKFITTNYDRWLKLKPNNNDNWQQIKDQVNTEEREFIYRDFCENLQKNDIVFQIHGSLNNFKSMVVSTSDYLKRYLGDKDAKTIDEENDLLRFLEYVFDNYTVLFIGYGLEELEILEYILLKAGHSKTPRHYILQGFYSNQYKLMKRMENYFKNHCKVTMIPFSLDKKEWNQLEDILKDYANKLPNYRHPIFHKIQTLNNLSKKLKEGETYRDSFIKTMISNEETEIDEDSKLQIEDKGFELLLKSNDPSIYFDQLKGNNVFNLERRQRVETSNSQWPPLHYLYIITENIDFTPEFVSDLVGIMGNIINSIKNGQFPFEKWMLSRKFLKIFSRIPTDQINREHLKIIIQFAKYEGSCDTLCKHVIPHFTEKKEDPYNLNILLRYAAHVKPEKNISIPSFKSNADVRDLLPLFQIINQSYINKMPAICADIYTNNITVLFSPDIRQSSSFIYRPAIEEHEQNKPYVNLEDIYIEALRDILDLWAKQDQQAVNEYIEQKLVKSKIGILKRISLYVINQNWEHLKDLFYKYLINDIFIQELHHEIYHLLAEHFSDFPEETKKTIYAKFKKIAHEKNKFEINLLHAIKDKGDKRIDILLSKLEESNSLSPPDGADFLYIISHPTFVPPPPSPISEEDIRALFERGELVNELNPVENNNKDTRSLDSLSMTLRGTVSKSPEFFSKNLRSLLKLKDNFQIDLLIGFSEAWDKSDDKEETQDWDTIWPNLIGYIDQYIKQISKGFEVKKEQFDFELFSQISRLIQGGTQSDDKAFSEDLLPKAFSIVTQMLSLTPKSDSPPESPIDFFLNSPRGSILQTLVFCTLRECRLKDQNNQEHEFNRKLFEKELNSCQNSNFEFSVCMGKYLPHLFYIDKDWTTTHFDKIFNSEQKSNFISAVCGLSVSALHRETLKTCFDKGLFVKAFQATNIPLIDRFRLIKIFGLIYLDEIPQLNSAIMSILLSSENDLLNLIEFFALYPKSDLTEKNKNNIIEFWRFCIDHQLTFEGINSTTKRKLSNLTRFIDQIDNSNIYLILEVADDAPKLNNSFYTFAKELDRLFPGNERPVLNILLKMSKANSIDYDPGGIIIPLVKKLMSYQPKDESWEDDLAELKRNLWRVQGIDKLLFH